MLSAMSQSRGVPVTESTFLVSLVGLTDLFSRLLLGFVYDIRIVRGNRAIPYAVFTMSCGLATLIAGFATEYWMFVISVILFGLSNSSMVSQRASVMGDYLVYEKLSSAIGIGNFFQGIGLLSGPLIAGKFCRKQYTNQYAR